MIIPQPASEHLSTKQACKIDTGRFMTNYVLDVNGGLEQDITLHLFVARAVLKLSQDDLSTTKTSEHLIFLHATSS